jgi:hypothetical protein
MLDKAGITLKKPLAFHSAMESQDAATREALNKAGFSSNLVFMDTVESRLPQVDKNHPDLLLIPQTLSNPEGILAEGDPDEAFAQFVREINLSHDMGGMTLIKFMARSSLDTDQLATIWKMSADPKMNFWHSSVGDVTNWIRQKNSMSNEIVLSKNSASIFLKYSTEGHFNPTIIVDLPFSGSNPVMTVRSTGQIIKPIIRGLAAYFVINSELAKDVDLSVSFDSH